MTTVRGQEPLDGLRESWLGRQVRRYWPEVQVGLDMAIWFLAVPFVVWMRYEFAFEALGHGEVYAVALLGAALQAAVGYTAGLYRRRFRYGSFGEVRVLTAVAVTVTALLEVVVLVVSLAPEVPRSVPLLGGTTALVGMFAVRYLWRILSEATKRPADAEPLVVLGAGEGGEQALRTLLRSRLSPYLPLALLDDDPAKRHLRLEGVRVQGTRRDLPEVARRYGATKVLVAIPSASSELIREVRDIAEAAEIDVLVLPPVEELFDGVGLGDIRPVTEEDLLGRHPADIDVDAIAHIVAGKRVLVTGAGGSIGSELARQLHRYAPSELFLLDRDESGLHGVQLSIEGRALLDSPNLLLADIRDSHRLHSLFTKLQPEVVFHAAALKHLPLLERAPEEAWRTNVLGTQTVLDAARAVGVERFVNISTDKAADPESVLGYSKRITERLTAQAAKATGRPFVSVRFGNVLGSRGSMLGTFEAQIKAGGPVTVTHRDVTRYFMTVAEAVRLTIQAAAIGAPGQVMVLDMGEPVKIADVARRLVERANRPVKIVYTGLRPGEKLHEDLLGAGEGDVRPFHPLISHVDVPPVTIDEVLAVTGEPGTDRPVTAGGLAAAAFLGLPGPKAAPAAADDASTRAVASTDDDDVVPAAGD